MVHTPNEPTEPAPADARPRNLRVLDSTPVRYDTETETRLLSSLMADPSVWPAVEGHVAAKDFWDATAGHSHIFAAIEALHSKGANPWAPQVIDELRKAGLLEVCGGAGAIEALANSYPPGARQRSADDARLVAHYARSRRFLAIAEDLKSAASKADHDAALALLHRAGEDMADDAEIASSWLEVDVAALLEAGLTQIRPTMLARDDDECLIYPGRTHAFNAEPEAGKSFVATWLCAERIAAGEHAVYIDFEDNAEGVIGRLLSMGISAAEATERFHYVRPDDPFDLVARSRILDLIKRFTPTIVVIDGVAEAMAMNGWDENSNADIAAFLNALPRLIEREGPAVVMIDHLVKDKSAQGRFARGGTHKLAGITGAAYKLEVVSPLAVGKIGKIKVTVTKDRPGWVRRCSVGSRVAFIEVVSSDNGTTVAIDIQAPEALRSGSEFLPTEYMERVSVLLESADAPMSKRAIREAIKGDNKWVDMAVVKLMEHGYIANDGSDARSAFRLIESYQADAESGLNRAVDNAAVRDEFADRKDLD